MICLRNTHKRCDEKLIIKSEELSQKVRVEKHLEEIEKEVQVKQQKLGMVLESNFYQLLKHLFEFKQTFLKKIKHKGESGLHEETSVVQKLRLNFTFSQQEGQLLVKKKPPADNEKEAQKLQQKLQKMIVEFREKLNGLFKEESSNPL